MDCASVPSVCFLFRSLQIKTLICSLCGATLKEKKCLLRNMVNGLRTEYPRQMYKLFDFFKKCIKLKNVTDNLKRSGINPVVHRPHVISLSGDGSWKQQMKLLSSGLGEESSYWLKRSHPLGTMKRPVRSREGKCKAAYTGPEGEKNHSSFFKTMLLDLSSKWITYGAENIQFRTQTQKLWHWAARNRLWRWF